MAKIITGKQEILSDLEKRVNDKILEQSNFDLLKKLVENADTLDEAIKIAELGTTYKRTGFHFDKRLERQSNTISYFKKNNVLSFEMDTSFKKNDTPLFDTAIDTITHKLIVGDNYPTLLNLCVEYKGKIDVIYIDPPYAKDSMNGFAETNYDNAITRDNLLSMLYPRLFVAKQLLSDSGVIFCSIDDRNHAYIKCIFDEIFSESNFIGTFVINSTPNARDYGHIGKMHEYMLFYTKNINDTETVMLPEEDKSFKYNDEKGGFNVHPLYNSNEAFTNLNRPNLYYPFYLYTDKKIGNEFYEIGLENKNNCIEIYPPKSQKNNVQFVWR